MNAALMHAATKLLQDPPNPEGNAGYTPVIVKTTDETPAAANSTQSTPAVATRTWHHTATASAPVPSASQHQQRPDPHPQRRVHYSLTSQ